MPATPAGPSAVVITVPEAEPAVQHLRLQYDPSAAQNMPAHITLLYPFLSQVAITSEVLAEVGEIIGSEAAFDAELREIRRFPSGGLYLQPNPAEPFRRLTEKITARWPQCPPYEGAFSEIVPHLTIAYAPTDSQASQIAADLVANLPITFTVTVATIFVPDGLTWKDWRTAAFS